MELTPEQLERIRREEFVAGYVEAVRDFGSGLVASVTLAHRAFEKRRPQ
jgi:hypothetical protein